MKRDYWPQKWMVRITNSNLSEDNKEVLLNFMQHVDDYIHTDIAPVLSVLNAIKDINLKHLDHDDLLSIFKWFYETKWIYTSTTAVSVKFQIARFLDFVDKTYSLGLNPKKEFSEFMKKKKIEEIKSLAGGLSYGTN